MTNEKIDYDAMSDEEFMLADNIPVSEPIESSEEDSTGTDEDKPTENEEESEDHVDGDTQDEDADEDAEDEVDDDTVDGDDDQAEDEDEDTDDTDGDQETEDSDDANEVDFEAGYKEIMAPFKANGKEMTLDNVEDVRRLVSMGVGFSEKMRILKPHLKIIKSLKDNGLLDQGKLDHLIDVSKNDPKAIAKLVKDGGIDPLDIKTEEAGDYEPNSYGVSDSEYDLDQAIDAIRGNESFDESIKVMGEQWDQKSKATIAENPEIVGIIDNHIQSGIFETVQGYVAKEKALGRMVGLSDVEAYREGATALQKSGVLTNDSEDGKTDENNDETDEKEEVNSLEKEARKKKAAKVKADKKRAAPAKSTPKKKGKKKGDGLENLSDEDFLKQFSQL